MPVGSGNSRVGWRCRTSRVHRAAAGCSNLLGCWQKNPGLSHVPAQLTALASCARPGAAGQEPSCVCVRTRVLIRTRVVPVISPHVLKGHEVGRTQYTCTRYVHVRVHNTPWYCNTCGRTYLGTYVHSSVRTCVPWYVPLYSTTRVHFFFSVRTYRYL